MVSSVKVILLTEATTVERLALVDLRPGTKVFDTDLEKEFITLDGGATPSWQSINNSANAEVISSATSVVGPFIVTNGGTGYAGGDFIEPTGGSPTINAKLKVVAIGGGGEILAVALVPDQSNSGFYTSPPSPLVSNPINAVTGSGVNATITFTMEPAGTVVIDPNDFNALQFDAEHGYIGLPNIPTGFEDSVTMNEGGLRYLQRTDALEYRDNSGNRRVMSDLDVPLATKGDILGRESFQNSVVPVGLNAQIITADSTAIVGWSWKDAPKPAQFSQTITKIVDSTASETSIIGGGSGTLTIPAGVFKTADSFSIKSGGRIRTNGGGQTIQIKMKSGSVILGDTGVVTLSTITSLNFYEIELDFVVRSTGGAGSAEMVVNGQFNYMSTVGGGNYEGAGIDFINNTDFDDTISNTIDITVQWGSSSPLNVIASNYGLLSQNYTLPV